MSEPIFPLLRWEEGIAQASVPLNTDLLRAEALARPCLGVANDESGSDEDGDVWLVGDTPAGAFASFNENDIALARVIGGITSWHAWAPVEGLRITQADGSVKVYDATADEWNDAGGGGGGSTQGKQAIYVSAAAMRPSVTGGCAALAAVATGANLPDLLTLNFDPTTQEYAQFSLAMPKKWNRGTITFKPYWSHPSTTTNFGVVWSLQAVAVGNDDAIGAAYGTAQTSTDTGGTTDDLYVGPESSAITVAGSPGDEEMLFFRISRVTGDGGDTMAVDARLHGIFVYVTTDADTDA